MITPGITFPNIFAPVGSLFGQLLTGIDPSDLNPTYVLSNHQNYFFTHGENDKRIYPTHFKFIKNYSTKNNVKADFWLVPKAGHVDALFLFPNQYGNKMYDFFLKILKIKAGQSKLDISWQTLP